MPNGVCMIGAGCLKKLLEVIGGLLHLALDVTLSIDDEILIGVIGLLVIVALVVASSYRDKLGLPLHPPLVAFGAPL
jgi:hypothetical protein